MMMTLSRELWRAGVEPIDSLQVLKDTESAWTAFRQVGPARMVMLSADKLKHALALGPVRLRHIKTCIVLSIVLFVTPSELRAQVGASAVSPKLSTDLKVLAKRWPHDQLQIFTSPKYIAQDPSNARYVLPFVVAGALIPFDRHIEPDSSIGTQSAARRISDIGLYGTAATVSGLYIYGRLKHDDKAREAGLLSGESLTDSLTVHFLTRIIAGRLRPNQGNGHGDFFVNHALRGSFPSGHATYTWSMGTVLAHEYPSRKNKALWYGVGTAVAVGRVVGQKHFTSDVIVGSTLGFLVGRYVFHGHSQKNEVGVFDPALPRK